MLISLRPSTCAAGDVLFLPAYWWHEVITEPLPAGDELTVSLNFWFTATRLLLSPALPLRPPLRVELARQLEYLVSDALADQAQHVAAFCRGLTAQLKAIAHGACDSALVPGGGGGAPWQARAVEACCSRCA